MQSELWGGKRLQSLNGQSLKGNIAEKLRVFHLSFVRKGLSL